MPSLSDSFLQELRLKTDVVDLISSYVSLKKRGNTYVGLCPFHNEKTPSFTVYENTQSFYCFGCGAGGDGVSFMRKIENLDYIDAVSIQILDQFLPDFLADCYHMSEGLIIDIQKIIEVFFWNYQGMTLSSLRNIKNCHCGFILIYDLRRDFPFDNRTKNTHNKNLLEIILSQIGKKVLK